MCTWGGFYMLEFACVRKGDLGGDGYDPAGCKFGRIKTVLPNAPTSEWVEFVPFCNGQSDAQQYERHGDVG